MPFERRGNMFLLRMHQIANVTSLAGVSVLPFAGVANRASKHGVAWLKRKEIAHGREKYSGESCGTVGLPLVPRR